MQFYINLLCWRLWLARMTKQVPTPDLVCDSAAFTEMSWLGMVFGCINTSVTFQRTSTEGKHEEYLKSWFYRFGHQRGVAAPAPSVGLARKHWIYVSVRWKGETGIQATGTWFNPLADLALSGNKCGFAACWGTIKFGLDSASCSCWAITSCIIALEDLLRFCLNNN